MTTLPADPTVQTKISADLSWVRHHLISFALVGGLTFASIYGIESLISRHDHEAALRMESLAQTMVQQNKQVQEQTKAQIDALTQQNTVLQQEVGTLATAIATRDSQLQRSQAQVPQLTPDQLSLEWQKDIKNAGNIKPSLSGGYSVDQAGAVATVQLLEANATLELDKADLQKSNNSLQSELANKDSILIMERKSHVSDNQTNQTVLASKDAEIKDIKAQARKSKLRWFVIGFVAGRVSQALGF